MFAPHPSSVVCHTLSAPEAGVVTYDDPEGRSRVAILALAQDARGYLWIGTEHGPVRFDGMEWSAPSGLAALGTFEIWAIDTLEPHSLWAGTNGAGLRLIETHVTPCQLATALTSADGLLDDDIHVLCRDGAGALWVGTHHGLAVVEGRRVTAAWSTREGIPEAGICALCRDANGQMWAGSLHGLLRFDGGTLRACLTVADGLSDAAIYALCADTEGRMWAGTRDGIAMLHNGRVQATIQEGLPSPEVRALCLDRAGHVWAGTAKGLALIEQGQVRRCWTREQHLPSSSVWSLLHDRQGRLWVGTEAGLALLPQESLPARPLLCADASDGGAYTFATDRRRQVWIGTPHGLLTVAPDAQTETTPANLPPVLARAGAWVAHRDAVGRLWAAGRYGGLYALDPVSGETLAHLDDLNAVRCLADDSKGRLWAGTLGAGLACVDTRSGVVLHRITVEQGLPSDHVSSLCLDDDGRLWVATLGGVARVNRRTWTVEQSCGRAEGLPHLAVSGLVLGPDSQIWGTTQGGGLFRLDHSSGHVDGVWSVADGLPSDTLLSCAMDAEGALWLGTAHGLARFQPETGEVLSLGRPHGLPGESCQQGAMMVDEQERLWVGTTEGVAIVTPSVVPREIAPCAVYLTGLRLMGEERQITDGLGIEDSDYDLVIDYGAVTFVAAARVLYRTQLVGLESAWSQPQPHRFARYTNLRPGDYTFRVSARNWGGHWSVPAEWRFRVVRNRAEYELERERQRAEAAEAAVRVRNEVLSTVAHDLRTPLTAIKGHVELLQLRLERAEPPSREWLRAQAGILHDGTRRMAAMVEEIMEVAQLPVERRPALDLKPIDLGALVQGVTRELEAGGPRDVVVAFDAASNLIVEGDKTRLERVMLNLIDNALKYSPAGTPVHVTVRPRRDEVIVGVQDRGVGIPANELSHIFTPYYRASTAQGIPGTGLGLAGAKTIVEQHGGRTTLESHTGQGTTVTIALPRHVPEAPPSPPAPWETPSPPAPLPVRGRGEAGPQRLGSPSPPEGEGTGR